MSYAAALPAPRLRAPQRRTTIGDLIRWVFGTATVITNTGKAMFVDRLAKGASGTYTVAPKWIALGVGATGAARTAVVTDTALSSEKETRTECTPEVITTGVTGDTYQVKGLITATAEREVDEAGVFDQLAAGGNMFTSATFPKDNLKTSDSITFTWKVQLT